MKEFWSYFLGQGDTVEFVNFSAAHIVPILIAVLLIYCIYRGRNRLRDSEWDMRLRYVMAFALMLSEMSYFWRLIAIPSLNPNPIDHLPITVCGWVAIFSGFMMVGKAQTLFDLSYFWLFSGTLFALITPTVITYTGRTRFRYYEFWVQHLLGYVAIFYMIFVHKMRPTIKSAVKAYLALMVMAVIAYSTNQMLGPGANYLFMARPESTPSVLDILPPNFALRIAVMIAAITLLFGLAYLPWYLKDRRAKKAATSAD